MVGKRLIRRAALLKELQDGSLVLTGNSRLSRALSSDYEQAMLAAGREAWATPAVLPWSAWLLDAWEKISMLPGPASPRLLSAEQENQVWASIIKEDGAAILRVRATAGRLRASWKLIQDWKLDLADKRFGLSDNSRAFVAWASRFKALQASEFHISNSDVPALLAAAALDGRFKPPPRIILTGFYELTPTQTQLLLALREAGCSISWVEIEGCNGSARRVALADAHDEMKIAVRWARQLLANFPDARIGIVIPDLEERRAQLTHMLRKVFQPSTFSPGHFDRARLWNVSLGRKLSDYPVIRTALGLLGLINHPVSTLKLGSLLASPYWALPRELDNRLLEQGRRSLLDKKIRSYGDALVSLSSIRYYAGQSDKEGNPMPWQCGELASRLHDLTELSNKLQGSARAGVWAKHFSQWLAMAGWPSARALDSHEYQAMEAWNTLLSEFSSLTDFTGALSKGEAVSMLGQFARETIFQPGSNTAAIQVLGLYEANGQEFDHLWVMDMHDGVWPPAPRPNPFIPLQLQRESGLPHSSPEQEFELAVLLTSMLMSSAKEVVFSYPGRQGNEELVCSPLISQLPEIDKKDISQWPNPSWQELIRKSASLELRQRPHRVAVGDTRVRGGSAIFRNQSRCPFKAFAEHRLAARPLDSVQIGLGPARRGSLLHKVLELFWTEIRSHEDLLALDAEQLLQLVGKLAEQAIEEMPVSSRHTMSPQFSRIEAARLGYQVLEWLEVEKNRSSFSVEGRPEQRIQFDIEGVEGDISIDRIDRLDNGRIAITDYKTGSVSPAGWFGDRPDEPQLPLYCEVLGHQPIDAVAFGEINSSNVRFVGAVKQQGILPGLPNSRGAVHLKEAAENWPQVLDDWSGVIRRLASEFSRGDAAVDPARGLKTCNSAYCSLAPLCRIHEMVSLVPDSHEGGKSDD